MKDYRKWTKEEENIVIDILNSFPGNNTYCFLLASEKINRTPNAIYEKYRLKIGIKELFLLQKELEHLLEY